MTWAIVIWDSAFLVMTCIAMGVYFVLLCMSLCNYNNVSNCFVYIIEVTK